jgi:hypothetical protein
MYDLRKIGNGGKYIKGKYKYQYKYKYLNVYSSTTQVQVQVSSTTRLYIDTWVHRTRVFYF